MSKKFTLVEDDKELLIAGPFELNISIDFDDVDHAEVRLEALKLVRLLNKHWGRI